MDHCQLMHPGMGGSGWTVLQAASSLALVVGLVLLTGWAARRHGTVSARATQTGALHLRASLALDARRRLHLVETPVGPVLAMTGGAQDRLVVLAPPLQAGVSQAGVTERQAASPAVETASAIARGSAASPSA